MKQSHFINRTMPHIDHIVELENMPVAGQVWSSEYGIEYTILSVQNKEKTVRFQEPGNKVRSAKVFSTWVTALAYDLSEERANGKMDGVAAHFVYEVKAEKFVKMFTPK